MAVVTSERVRTRAYIAAARSTKKRLEERRSWVNSKEEGSIVPVDGEGRTNWHWRRMRIREPMPRYVHTYVLGASFVWNGERVSRGPRATKLSLQRTDLRVVLINLNAVVAREEYAIHIRWRARSPLNVSLNLAANEHAKNQQLDGYEKEEEKREKKFVRSTVNGNARVCSEERNSGRREGNLPVR